MPSPIRDLSNLHISESFYRLLQTDPVDDKTLLDGTGSLVTYLTVSGSVDVYHIKTNGTGSLNGIHTFTGSLVIPSGTVQSNIAEIGSVMTSGSNAYIYL